MRHAGTMSTTHPTHTTVADLRVHLRRTAKGTLATCQLKTPSEIRWHRITLPPEVPAYAVWEQAAQSALAKFADLAVHQTTLQMQLR